MKHSTFLLVFSLLLFSDVYAQPPARLKKVSVSKYMPNVNAYAPWDSTVYYYSGNNRGYLVNETFFSGVSNTMSGTISTPWVSFTKNMYSPHLLGNQESQYDSLILYQRHIPTGIVPYLKNKQTIANNVITKNSTEEYSSANNQWNTKRASQYTYHNNLLSSHIYLHNLNTDTINYRYVTNTNNLPDSLIVTHSNSEDITYTYSYNNNLLSELNTYYSTSGHYKTLFDYNSSGLVKNSSTFKYNTGTSVWDTVHVFNYSYNTNNQLAREEFLEINIYTNQGLKLLYTIDIQYDNNNNRVEDIVHFDYYKHGLNTGLAKVAKKQYGYNSFGLISNYEVAHWIDTAQAWGMSADSLFGASQKVELEYDVFWPQDISTVNEAEAGLTIFPSPASGFITVKADEMSAGDMEAIIYDMQGRILRKWADKADSKYLRTIPVQELPAGSYILQLKGNEISRSEKFVIYR